MEVKEELKEKLKEQDAMALAVIMQPIIGQLRRDKKFSAVHVYKCVLCSFLRFAAEVEMPLLTVDEIFQPGTLKEYETWLRSKGASWNTVSTYMRTLRAVYNRIVHKGIVLFNPQLFDDVYTRVQSLTKRALNNKQMQALLADDVSSLPKELQCAHAYFLLTFLLRGMPFIDLMYLQKSDIKGDFITYCRHKTGKQITVRISRYARKLFEKFCDKSPESTFLFPILAAEAEGGKIGGSYLNDEQLYACYLRALRRFNYQLTKIAKLKLPGIKLSSYTARHTWATLVYHKGVSIGIISSALGHSSCKVTETYLKPFENQKIDDINDELIAVLMKGIKGVAC